MNPSEGAVIIVCSFAVDEFAVMSWARREQLAREERERSWCQSVVHRVRSRLRPKRIDWTALGRRQAGDSIDFRVLTLPARGAADGSCWNGFSTLAAEEVDAMLPGCAGVIVVTAIPAVNTPSIVGLRALALATTLRAIERVGLAERIPVAYYDAEGMLVSPAGIEPEPLDDLLIPRPERAETVPAWVGRVTPGFSVLDLTGSQASFAEVVALMDLGPGRPGERGLR